jgi:ClpP class serine protease
MRELLEKLIAQHSGKTPEEVNLDIERDKILTADAAVEYGLIDSILESRKAAMVGTSVNTSLVLGGPAPSGDEGVAVSCPI